MDLQSEDHRDLLDIIDKLRLQGLGRYVDLPEIVVCGDQSSGKSSILEAISRMSFPAKDNLCTRFATELILRRNPNTTVSVSIRPSTQRSAEESERLLEFKHEFKEDNIDLGDAIEAAKLAMGISEHKVFSQDTLRVELIGPEQPHLTLVDLPGLFCFGSKDQSMDDAATIRELVRGYIARPRSVIVAVVSAESEINLQDVTEFTRQVDPEGLKALGLITKPDMLEEGSESESAYVRMLQNTDVVLRSGWHVLMNRSYATTNERDASEAIFFEQGITRSIHTRRKEVKTMKARLSDILRDQILIHLPDLSNDVEMVFKTADSSSSVSDRLVEAL